MPEAVDAISPVGGIGRAEVGRAEVGRAGDDSIGNEAERRRALGRELLEATARLVDVGSVTFHEREIADLVEAELVALPWLEVERIGDNIVARTDLGRTQRILLAGHLDTVPGDPGALVEGDRVTGLGAADMKGGLAVLSWLAGAASEPRVDLTFVFYVAEEVAQVHNGLRAIHHARPELLAADAAILAEPTGGMIEAGCQGSLRVQLTLGGRRAHTARPWMGENAIHRLAPMLELLATYRPREPVLEGCTYRESLQAVAVEAGVAPNVLPDSATLLINHRFAPDRTSDEALERLHELFAPTLRDGEELEVVDVAEAAPPSLGHPLLAALVDAVGSAPRAKLGWTDVSRLFALGVPALNFGPGSPELAHTPGEWVEASELAAVAVALRQLVVAPGQLRKG